MVKKLLYITIALSLFLTDFLFVLQPSEAQAAEMLAPQAVTYQDGDMLFTMTDGNSYGSKQQSVTPNEVTVINPTSDPITKVELRDANTHTVLQEMVHVSGNQYKAAAPISQQGQIIVGTPTYVSLDAGSFQWFRDPNKKVWMFDYDDPAAEGGLTHRFYRNKDNAIYDAPPPNSCLQHKGGMPYGLPAYPSGYESTVTFCDSAYDYREGILPVAELSVLSNTSIKMNTSDAVHLEFNTSDFQLDDAGTLKAANISGMSTDYIDIPTMAYRFSFTTLFSTNPDEPPDDSPDGRVLTWYSNWKIKLTGYVYKYPKLEAVAYTTAPTAKTDLSIPSLTGPSCIEAGTSATFSYKISNSGPATSTVFKVKISADGTEIHTFSYQNGIGMETVNGNFNYTFPAAGTKSITVLANSDNALDEESTTNNLKTVPFTVVADCDPAEEEPGGCSLGAACPGEWTGTLTVHYPTIDWKDPNDFQVTLINPANGCTAQKGRFLVSQGTKQYAYGWATIVGTTDSTGFGWGMGGSSTYPANIDAGTVTVLYTVEDSCGSISNIGPEPFEIVKVAGAPTVILSWYDSATNAEVTDVIQGTNVYLKPKITDSQNENVTRLWNFNNGSPWASGLPAAKAWATPFTAAQYTNIVASEKGSHKVCVTGTNESLVAATGCATLYVIGPEPIAVIDVGGWLKEGRRIELSGSRSSSPKGSALSYAWTIAPIAGQTTGTQAEIQYIAPLSGVVKDFKTPKLGNYQVTLVVTDTEGLTGTAYKVVIVAPDIPPINSIVGNNVATRQPSDRGLGTFTLIGNAFSIDQDLIVKRHWSFSYDYNNDGIFNEPGTVEIDEDTLVMGWEYPYTSGLETLRIFKTGVNTIQVKGEHVGKYNTTFRATEAPGQPTNLIH
ncbi:CARDB domain-containing protein [Paenibacillus agricola]|uniref:PKD/Chitinase domain-containing protein n=1 Tax=Paenibacillus agricola TaxID=2716264 RepID=A0ABX0J1I9_9BACL|nr:CARDB domain-containing protein [Paenibacillus agricola]NHN30187.1 hypothetical protein [Paenibacillus agricola]